MPRFKEGDVVYLAPGGFDRKPGFYEVKWGGNDLAGIMVARNFTIWRKVEFLVKMQEEFWQSYAPSFLWFANDNARSDPKWEVIERDEVIQCIDLNVVRRMESRAAVKGIAVYGTPGCDWKLVRSDLVDTITGPTPEQGKVL